MASPSIDSVFAEAPVIVLASASPRRRELLMQIGVPHAVQVADIDESVLPDESPENYVMRLARAKAVAVAARDNHQPVISQLPVLGADTTVVIDGRILGKPVDADDAIEMLRALGGREHRVLTAVAISFRGQVSDQVRDQVNVALSTTRVWFRERDDELIARYVASGEPLDKAGAYGIQGLGAALVTRIDGSYSGVVGLPLAETADLLRAAGVGIWRHG